MLAWPILPDLTSSFIVLQFFLDFRNVFESHSLFKGQWKWLIIDEDRKLCNE